MRSLALLYREGTREREERRGLAARGEGGWLRAESEGEWWERMVWWRGGEKRERVHSSPRRLLAITAQADHRFG